MKIHLIIFLAAAIFTISGCAMFSDYTEKAAEEIATGIATYCAATIESERAILREKVNALAAPNTIVITCDGGI